MGIVISMFLHSLETNNKKKLFLILTTFYDCARNFFCLIFRERAITLIKNSSTVNFYLTIARNAYIIIFVK